MPDTSATTRQRREPPYNSGLRWLEDLRDEKILLFDVDREDVELAIEQFEAVISERDQLAMELSNLQEWMVAAQEHVAPAIAKAIKERLPRD